MQAIVLAALIAAVYQIARRSISDAVIRVYLPVLLLIPTDFCLFLPHMPPLNFTTCAIIPIGIALFCTQIGRWKFTRTDLWLAIYIGGCFYSNLAANTVLAGQYSLFRDICEGLFPYMIGKLLLEQGNVRERFVRRFVSLMVFWALISLWEFRMGSNLFAKAFERFFPGQFIWGVQFRLGFARVGATSGSAELAGMLALVGMMLSRWLMFKNKDKVEKKILGLRVSTLVFFLMAFGVFMSGSRGPELGAVLSIVIAQVGAAKSVKRAAILALLVIGVGGVAGYTYSKSYLSGTMDDAKDKDQGNAIYRRMLVDNYKPIVEKGGLFGWGDDFPTVNGQFSIDNQFLLVQLTRGQLGFWMYVLLCAEGAFAILRRCWKVTNRVDLCFYACLGGLLAGDILTLTTVFMGAQIYPLFFLVLGWSQSLRETETTTEAAPPQFTGRFAFQRVFA